MAAPGIPNQFNVQQGNMQVLITSAPSVGATSYSIQRSLDGVNFTPLATPTLPSYVDTTVTVGTQYWYQMASVNISGTSPYTNALSTIPTPTAEMSLQGLRLASQQKSDRVNSNFVTTSEWNTYINLAYFELYDLLETTYEDYFIATPATFVSDGTTFLYPLPNGITTYLNGLTGAPGYIAPPFYKLRGVDLAVNNAANAYVTVNKFMFADRNKFVYPNTASTIYGVFNLQYRLMGNAIEFIPTPSAGQQIRIWYTPRLTQLLQDTDITTIGYSGWLQYVIVRAAKYALDKEESDTTNLTNEILFLKARIEESSVNRDAGQPDRISNTRGNNGWYDGSGWGFNGPSGGW